MQVENIDFSCQVPQPIKRVYVPSSRQFHTTTRFGFILRFSLVPSFEGLYLIWIRVLFSSRSSCIMPFIDVITKGTGCQIGISSKFQGLIAKEGGNCLLIYQPARHRLSPSSLFPFLVSPSRSLVSFLILTAAAVLLDDILSFTKSHSLLRTSTHTFATMFFAQVFAGAFVAVLAGQC